MCSSNNRPLWVNALLDGTLTHGEYRLVAYVIWRQGKNEAGWPSQQVIAHDLNMTVEAIRKITKRVESKGWISVERSQSGGRGHRLKYRIHPPQNPQQAFPLSQEKPPTSVGASRQKTPNKRTKKPPTPVGVPIYEEHLQRTLTVLEPQKKAVDSGSLFGEDLDSKPPHILASPKIRRKRKPTFVPPTEEEVREYATSKGYPDFDATRFVEYYAAAQWHDTNGNPVRNWKQKFLGVWARREQPKPEPKRGDPDWDPDEAEANRIFREAGIIS